jgi:serine/threonine protein kinase
MNIADGHTDGEGPPGASAAIPEPGVVFDGKYRIEGTIGEGAMGVVLEATHLQLEDRVAIKILLPVWAADPRLVERFMREGRAATKIRSEHVVRVFDVGVVSGHPYLVMEHLDGKDLDRLLAEEGVLPAWLAVDYLLQACEAIAEAHVSGIIHRDLKPANLFLTRRADGSACVKVLDFGISKATHPASDGSSPAAALSTREGAPAPGAISASATTPTAVMGSPQYMSPEQLLSSRNVDARSDVWALGAILHELIAGAPPFDGETFAELSAAILRDPAPRLTALRADVPAIVADVVVRCLEKEPSARFADVAALAGALAEVGTASARASAERIARVIDGTGKLGLPSAPPASEVRMPRAAALLDEGAPQRGRRRLGYVLATAALACVAWGIVSMVVRDRRQSVEAGPGVEAPGAPALVPTAASAPGASAPASPTVNAAPSAVAAASATPDPARNKDGRGGTAPARAGGALVPAHPPHVHARPQAPRHAHRGLPGTEPPLPDFPIPSADPATEPPPPPFEAPAPAPRAAPPPSGSAPPAASGSASPLP